jgi:hypothetical protein
VKEKALKAFRLHPPTGVNHLFTLEYNEFLQAETHDGMRNCHVMMAVTAHIYFLTQIGFFAYVFDRLIIFCAFEILSRIAYK